MPKSMSNSQPKKVTWNLEVEEFAALGSPESWTVALPGSKQQPFPPTPRPTHNLPLPSAGLLLHDNLTPAYALQLDFSFPSAYFRGNPQLSNELLDTPASTPPRASFIVRVSAGHLRFDREVRHPGGGAVTLGDILSTIQSALRQPDDDSPEDAGPYTARRIATVNGYNPSSSTSRSAAQARAREEQVKYEREGGAKVVDRLLGHTLFAGLTPLLGKAENYLMLELKVPQRYAA